MNLDFKECVQLAVDAYNGTSTKADFSAEERQEGLRTLFADLAKENGGFALPQNRELAFAIVTEAINQILPKDIKATFDNFVEFKTFGNNERPEFVVRNGKIKAFEVAVGGTVERQRIDGGKAILGETAIQTHVYDELERFINGDVDFTELINLAKDALIDKMYEKIVNVFKEAYDKFPDTNKAQSAGFDVKSFNKILNVVKAYGKPMIMGTPVALAEIPLEAQASEADKLDVRNKGYLGMYRGCKVIELENTFTDVSNTEKVLSDEYIYILPEGVDKPIKLALIGEAISRTNDNADWTQSYEVYQKLGVGLLALHNIGIYQNSSLA